MSKLEDKINPYQSNFVDVDEEAKDVFPPTFIDIMFAFIIGISTSLLFYTIIFSWLL